MKNLVAPIKKIVKKGYRAALRSIAFYPILISFTFFCLAFLTLSLENVSLILNVKQRSPYLFIGDVDTARSILSTLIAGILSLTVFSFTMVMVVLNQASSNFSPRLLPGLLSNKRHQIILGCYVGTLLYCTIVLIALGAYELDNRTVGMSTTVGAMFGLFCVGLFVSFIHNISGAVQIQNIVGEICKRTHIRLDDQLRQDLTKKTALQYVGKENRATLSSHKSGYFQGFDIGLLDAELFESDVQLTIIPHLGQHLWEGAPLMKLNSRLTEKQKRTLNFACIISYDLHEGNYPLLNLIKLMEVAVRAMSPGINDPGTAIDVVHKLGPLLDKMIRLPAFTSVNHARKGIVAIKSNITTAQLLGVIVQPIRHYGKNDVSLMIGLVRMLKFLNAKTHLTKKDTEALTTAIQAIGEDIRIGIANPNEKERIASLLSGSTPN